VAARARATAARAARARATTDMSENNNNAVCGENNNIDNGISSSNDDNNNNNNDNPYANSFSNYLKYLEKLEHSPKISKDGLARVKDALRDLMSEHPTLFCKLFSGNQALSDEAMRELKLILYQIEKDIEEKGEGGGGEEKLLLQLN
jgi:hypothetical protein